MPICIFCWCHGNFNRNCTLCNHRLWNPPMKMLNGSGSVKWHGFSFLQSPTMAWADFFFSSGIKLIYFVVVVLCFFLRFLGNGVNFLVPCFIFEHLHKPLAVPTTEWKCGRWGIALWAMVSPCSLWSWHRHTWNRRKMLVLRCEAPNSVNFKQRGLRLK